MLGKDLLPKAGEYTSDVVLRGLGCLPREAPGRTASTPTAWRKQARGLIAHKAKRRPRSAPLPPRPPAFCTGCPERPVFAAIKLLQREVGRTHISADIGCHSFATLRAVQSRQFDPRLRHVARERRGGRPELDKRPIAIMGDGGFWHNGLITGVASQPVQQGRRRADDHAERLHLGHRPAIHAVEHGAAGDGPVPGVDIEKTLRALGVKWLRTVRTYSVAKMVDDADRRRCAPPSAASR